MSEKRPICPACRKPLCGELVASHCNHVFHRRCLSEATGKCVQCGEEHGAKDALDLFGVSFGEALDPGAAALAAKIAEAESCSGGDNEAVAARAERLRAAATLLAQREEVKELRNKLAEQRALAEAARQRQHDQAGKLRAVQKANATKASDSAKAQKEVDREAVLNTSLLAKIDLARQAGTVYEYWDKIKAGQEEQGLKYLLTMVSMAPTPARILAEVARLRSHVRENLARERKEADSASRRWNDGRKRLADLESETTRRGAPASKRLRA